MINTVIELLALYCQSGIFDYGIYQVLALAVVVTVPCMLRALVFQKRG